jgi:hypothetical protein
MNNYFTMMNREEPMEVDHNPNYNPMCNYKESFITNYMEMTIKPILDFVVHCDFGNNLIKLADDLSKVYTVSNKQKNPIYVEQIFNDNYGITFEIKQCLGRLCFCQSYENVELYILSIGKEIKKLKDSSGFRNNDKGTLKKIIFLRMLKLAYLLHYFDKF